MLICLFRLLSMLPLPLLHAVGVALGWVVYLSSPSYRARLQDNLARAGYREYLRTAIGESGKNILELPFIWYASPQRVMKSVSIRDWQVVEAAVQAKRGVLFLTPHLGCFEVSAQATSTRLPLTALYRPPRKKMLQPLVESARTRATLALAPANLAGVRTLLKVLKKGGAVGLLPDQVPQHGEGVWADFFGKPAYTMTLPAKLQQMTGATIVLAYAERLPYGQGYVLRFVPFDDTLAGSAAEQAQAINAAMEKLIARCPAQYLWSYNRYKTPAGTVKPPAAAEQNG